ncbi:glycosyltransferase [Aeromicrobium sp. UC242_57]|uniref:glycosyltransferase n=1 Tax=Aeromicrobium sp. UC242_57 TaxID=3374624 RepID=UPI00378B9FAF
MGTFVRGPFPNSLAPHPAWSAKRYLKVHPQAADHPYGVLGHLYDDFGPHTQFHLLGPDRRVKVRWAEVETTWRDLATTWTRHRRRLMPAWLDSLPEGHDQPLFPEDIPTPDITVSVIIPSWNRAHVLRTAVESVQAQTWSNWEIFVIDDGSTDETISVVNSMAKLDSRIHLITRPHEGVCAARNSGIDASRGELIAFLDSDNAWRPDYLRHMVLTMTHRDVDVAYATLETLTDSGLRYRARQVTREILLAHNHVDLNVLVVRATTLRSIGGFDPSLRRTVDYDLVLRLSEVAELVHVPVVGVHYDGADDRDDRISTQQPMTWADVVRLKHLVDWDELAAADRIAEQISVVIPAGLRARDTLERVKTVRAELGSQPWEIVVVDHTVSRRTLNTLLPTLVTDPRVRYRRVAEPASFAFTANLGFSMTHGARVLFLDFDTQPEPGTVTALVEASRRVDGPHVVQAVSPSDGPAGRTFMTRAVDFIQLRGLQVLLHNEFELADLVLRLDEAEPGYQLEQPDLATVTRVSVSREHARHAANLKLFVERHGHEPTADLQRL